MYGEMNLFVYTPLRKGHRLTQYIYTLIYNHTQYIYTHLYIILGSPTPTYKPFTVYLNPYSHSLTITLYSYTHIQYIYAHINCPMSLGL